MSEKSVDELRTELRNLGYLTHGIERWFAQDPWSSRTFWAELVAVSAKAAFLLSFFLALPLVSIMVVRNRPIAPMDAAVLFGVYLVLAALDQFALLVLIALALRLKPTLALDRPAALTGVSIALASVVAAGIMVWWAGFGGAPTTLELGIGVGLVILVLVVATLVFSAALLSFSIHETKRIPRVAQKDRTLPLIIVAVVVTLVIVGWVYRAAESPVVEPPTQIVVAATDARVALLAVDGMTWDLFSAQRPSDLPLAFATPVSPLEGTHSSAERWATIGSGTAPSAHEVRAIDGIRLAGSERVLQSISRWDLAIGAVATATGLAKRIPLPPRVRRRHYVWEILGSRGISAAAVNWWVTDDEALPTLLSVSQATVFGAAARSEGDSTTLALSIDLDAIARIEDAVESRQPRFVTAYLPAIDIVLNRIELDPSARVAASTRAAVAVFRAARHLRQEGYEVVIVGMPGEGEEANAVVASTLAASAPPTLDTLAPTLLVMMGFPVSDEMSSDLFLTIEIPSRIPTYGDREKPSESQTATDEYYESLKSLGYIQ